MEIPDSGGLALFATRPRNEGVGDPVVLELDKLFAAVTSID